MDEREDRADLEMINQIIAQHRDQRWPLIPVLQEIQEELGYIPPEAIKPMAGAFDLFPSQVQGVITFYEQLHTVPRGKRIVRVCRGTACHVRGAKTILKLVKRRLDIEEGQTTPDLEYTLETVACIGVCALAPNMVIGGQTHGHLNPKRVAQLFGDRSSSKE